MTMSNTTPDRISYAFGCKINMGNYESVDVHMSLSTDVKASETPEKGSIDLAPSLMMSGSYSKSTKRIKHSLEKRYYINMLDNLFDNSTNSAFRKHHSNELATFSHKSAFSTEDIETEYKERFAAFDIVNTSILENENK